MDIIKEKGNENIELVNNGKSLRFSLTNLNYLKLTLTNDNKDKMWINESFYVDKKDTEVYNLIDSVFFSYCGETIFDTDGDYLILKKDDNRYNFLFLANLDKVGYNELSCEFVDYTTENSSMENLFIKLQGLEATKVKEPVKKLTKRIK